MGRAELGQVVDREGLAACRGAHGRLRIVVPVAWAAEGADIEITAPGRVSCARCDGGGCDGCARSGAFRLPGDPSARTLRLRLPGGLGPGERVVLRVVRPFEGAAALEQLLIEVSDGAKPSPGVVRVALPAMAPGRTSLRWTLTIAVALVIALVAALLANR